MAPKRKTAATKGRGGGSGKKAKATPDAKGGQGAVEKLLSGRESYCEELGIDLKDGGSAAAYQWLCCSIIFGNRISEKTTIRAAKGLIKSGLTDPKSVVDSDQWAKVEALNSQGNVQRGPSMASRLESTAATVLEEYGGDLDKLREKAGKDPEQERKLVKEFKGFGDTAVNIFCREVQLQWEELFPYADSNTLEMAGKHGLPNGSAQEIADLVDNDREKYVRLMAAVVKADLRGDDEQKIDGKAEEEDKKEEKEDDEGGEDDGKDDDDDDDDDEEEDDAEANGDDEAKEEA